MTKILKINENNIDLKLLKYAATVIKKGGIVAFPTETVYGLGANVYDPKAIKKIFKAKGRPSDNPLIVHVSDELMLKDLILKLSSKAKKLIKNFWPGPLTLIFNKSKKISFDVTAGLETVAIRMPRNKIAKKLIELSNCPIAAPSANTSTKPSPTNANHVIEDLNGKVDVIIDGGSCEIGLESTVLDITSKPSLILRPGAVTFENLKKFIEVDKYKPNNIEKPKSPGMKYRHYSPSAKLILLEGNSKKINKKIEELIMYYKKKNLRVGVLVGEGMFDADLILYLNSKEEIAKHLFSSFRTFDKMKMDFILMKSVSLSGIGDAILNRVEKAAYKKIILK